MLQNFNAMLDALRCLENAQNGRLATWLTEVVSEGFVHEGDELVVTRIDGRARSVLDLPQIVRQLAEKGVALKATEQPIDTGTAAGKCFLDMLSVFVEFDTNLRQERQMEGVAKAKAAGKYKGRPASINAVRLREMKANGSSVKEICGELGISRASVYRLLEASS